MPTTSGRLVLAAGITFRQLDHWARRGYVRPGRELRPYRAETGSGVPRIWGDDEIDVVLIMAVLVRHGVGLTTAAHAARLAHVTHVAGERVFTAPLGDGVVVEGVVQSGASA